jgi:hypothetical protein
MSVVINVRSNDGEEREKISFIDKLCNFMMKRPQTILWCFIITILIISISISEYSKQNKI